MTASDGRGSKSLTYKRADASPCHRTPPVSSMSRTTLEALALSRPLVFAWFHFSTWRVPRMAKP